MHGGSEPGGQRFGGLPPGAARRAGHDGAATCRHQPGNALAEAVREAGRHFRRFRRPAHQQSHAGVRQMAQPFGPDGARFRQHRLRHPVRRAQHGEHVGRRGGAVMFRQHQQVEFRPPQHAGETGRHAMHDPAAGMRLQPQRHGGRTPAGGNHQRRLVAQVCRRDAGGGEAEQRSTRRQPGEMGAPVPTQRDAAKWLTESFRDAQCLRRGAGTWILQHPDPC